MTETPETPRSFWTSLTGVITALAGFAAAVGTVLGLLAANNLWPFPPKPVPSDSPDPGSIVAAPPNHRFDDVQLGQASPTRPITVTNQRRDTAELTVKVKDDVTGSFEVALDTCSASTLESNSSCQLELVFSPKKVGQLVASVVVSLPDGRIVSRISLSGVGKPAGELSFKPTSVYLSLFTLLGKPTPPNTTTQLTITNTGSGTVRIDTVKLDDPRFTVSVGCHNRTLPPGGSCVLTVTFAVGTNGTYKSKMLVHDNAPGSPHEIPVTGYRGLPIVLRLPIGPSLSPRQ